MNQFIKDEGVKARLRMIREREKNGWEKWLQVELEYFISQTQGIHVDREVQAFPDRRMLRGRYNMFIDLAIRKKRSRINSYMFIELKCTHTVRKLINGFEKDIKKINSIKECIYDRRSFWCVGFHLNCTSQSITKIKEYVAAYEHGYHEVIKLCSCDHKIECDCTNNMIGFAVI